MPLPEPEPGLVISFSYLWRHEERAGEESGRKIRPCVLVSAAENSAYGIITTVTAITHLPPANTKDAVEIPLPVKKELGLDEQPSWVIVTEANQFIWPGFDLCPIPGATDCYAYGFLPPRLFTTIKNSLLEQFEARRAVLIKRG